MSIIACTSCQTRLKVAPEKIGHSLECPKCGVRFRAALQHEKAKARVNQTALLWAVAGVVAIGVAFVLYQRGFGSKAPLENHVGENDRVTETAKSTGTKPSTSAPTKPATADDALKARASEVIVAMRTGNDESLAKWVEHSRFHEAKRAAGESLPPWNQLPPEEQYVAREAVHAGLQGTGTAQMLVQRGAVASIDVTTPGTQLAVVTVVLKDPMSEQKQSLMLHFESIAGTWKLARLERGPIEGAAKLEATTAVTAPPATPRRAHPEAAVEAVEPVADESPLDRSTIDRSLEVLKDLASTKAATQARKDLVAVGKPAIPHLLNALIPLDFAKQEDLIVGQRIANTLIDVTGGEFPISPGGVDGSMLGDAKDDNEANRRRWFGWWRDHKATFTKREAGSFEDSAEDTDVEVKKPTGGGR